MSDLTDALDNWERIGVKGPIYEAARRVADAPEWLQRLLEDPPPEPDKIWWCETRSVGTVGFPDDFCQLCGRPVDESGCGLRLLLQGDA